MNTDLDMHVAQTLVSRGPTPSQHAFVEYHHVFFCLHAFLVLATVFAQTP